jgi:hypothetical protein
MKVPGLYWEGIVAYLRSPKYWGQVDKCPITGWTLPKLVVRRTPEGSGLEESNLLFFEKEWLC